MASAWVLSLTFLDSLELQLLQLQHHSTLPADIDYCIKGFDGGTPGGGLDMYLVWFATTDGGYIFKMFRWSHCSGDLPSTCVAYSICFHSLATVLQDIVVVVRCGRKIRALVYIESKVEMFKKTLLNILDISLTPMLVLHGMNLKWRLSTWHNIFISSFQGHCTLHLYVGSDHLWKCSQPFHSYHMSN